MRRIVSLSCTLATLLIASASHATLFEVDLFAAGDGLVTRDDVSGLDWLDVTAIAPGVTPADIAAGAGGWTAAGWRYATASEVCGLLIQVSSAPSPCPGSQGFSGDDGQKLLDLLGYTTSFSFDGDFFTQIWASYDDGTGGPDLGELEFSVDHYASGALLTYVGFNADVVTPTETFHDHLLVRVVPEPGSGLLLGLGLGAFATLRRGRR